LYERDTREVDTMPKSETAAFIEKLLGDVIDPATAIVDCKHEAKVEMRCLAPVAKGRRLVGWCALCGVLVDGGKVVRPSFQTELVTGVESMRAAPVPKRAAVGGG
jgi:hypothetical protein